jgi:lactate permease
LDRNKSIIVDVFDYVVAAAPFVVAAVALLGMRLPAAWAGLAAALGGPYPAVAPVVGALGGWLTGSNAASNALFMPLQIEAARGLDVSESLTAATQNVSGSHASLLVPQRVILAATARGCWAARATSPGWRSHRC